MEKSLKKRLKYYTQKKNQKSCEILIKNIRKILEPKISATNLTYF